MSITTAQIEALYQANLGRSSDADGLAYYSNLATNGVTLSEIDTMFRGSSEFARVNAPAPAPAPAPPPAPPPTGSVTGPAPAPPPAPTPAPGTGGVTTDTAATDLFGGAQWFTWASNRTVLIGGGILAALMLFGGARKR